MTLSSHGPRQLYFNHLVFQRAMGIVIISIFFNRRPWTRISL